LGISWRALQHLLCSLRLQPELKENAVMKKSIVMMVAGMSLVAATASAAVTVRYYNKDSKKYSFPAVCSGSHTEVHFDGSTTSSTTIQGSGPCTVKTAGGEVKLSGGENIEIKDGRIIVK
jgi:hypothetical protein